MNRPPLNAPVLARHLVLRRDLREIVDACESAGLPVLAMKGAVLADHLYSRPDLRPMEDIDLLAAARDEAAVRDRLESLGFRPQPDTPTNLVRRGTTIDLESGLWYLGPEEEARAWSRSIVLEADGLRLRTLSWEDHFIFMLAHSAAHHVWWDETHVEDLRLLLERPLDWKAAGERLARSRLKAASAASLDVLGLKAPAPLAEALRPGGFEAAEAAVWRALFTRGAPPALGHALRVWTAGDRSAFLKQWLFPSGSFMQRRYGAARGGWPVARRLAGLAASAIQAVGELVRG